MANVTADSQGAFRIDSIRAGQYVACAQVLTPGFLDPCHWATVAPEFTVAAGQTTPIVRVTMARGAVLTIHVSDPQALLKPVTSLVDFDCQFHIVTAKGIHYSASIQSASATGRDHSITVPFGTPLTVQAISPLLALSDAQGKVAPLMGLPVLARAGTLLPSLTYVVTGKK